MTVKAIETAYKGFRFRSRLEARWAVFFDALGTFWEYEPEGFDINGRAYLPDFRLHGAYVEIKPPGEEPRELMSLFRERVAPIVLVNGPPGFQPYHELFCNDMADSSAGSSEWPCTFALDGIAVVSDQEGRRDLCLNVLFDTWDGYFWDPTDTNSRSPWYQNAIYASRNIRF